MKRMILLTAVMACAHAQPAAAPVQRAARVLRVCADPNNLPFSNRREEGLENRVARILASELQAELRYTWWAQRRGFVRNTLNAGACDVWMEVPADFDPVLTTRPYYRSTYVFVTRADRDLAIAGFDDPALRRFTIGVQLIGKDQSNSPPAHALAARGLSDRVKGYAVYGDYARERPLEPIIDAVRAGEVDVAVVWGPVAGYFALQEGAPLRLSKVLPDRDGPLPLAFDIAAGVRKGNRALRDDLDAALVRRAADIRAVLDQFGVPWEQP